MHLSTDTIDLSNAILLPTLDPIDERLNLVVVVPVAFEVIVVDEELELTIVATLLFERLSIVLASKTNSLTDILEVAHAILPEEVVGIVGTSMLESIETTVITITCDCLVDNIPSLDMTLTCFHHSCNPLIHCPDESIVFLFWSQRNSALDLLFYLRPYTDIIEVVCHILSTIL